MDRFPDFSLSYRKSLRRRSRKMVSKRLQQIVEKNEMMGSASSTTPGFLTFVEDASFGHVDILNKISSQSCDLTQQQSDAADVSSCNAILSESRPISYDVDDDDDADADDEDVDDEIDLFDADQSATSLSEGLRNWAVTYGITLVALSSLLTLLKNYHPFLPQDGRTLMKTTRNLTIESRGSGSFYHFGLLTNVTNYLNKFCKILPDLSTLNIQLNIDGLPLFKSSSLQFWPVLGLLKESVSQVFVISLFCGKSKPSSLLEFLGPVIDEITQG